MLQIITIKIIKLSISSPPIKQKTNIIALESGIVTKAVKNVKGTNHKSKGLATYGNYVKIKQNDGKTALYAHMKYGSVRVNEGTYIEKGTVLGTIGETGTPMVNIYT